jgi:hypothetical protein
MIYIHNSSGTRPDSCAVTISNPSPLSCMKNDRKIAELRRADVSEVTPFNNI